MIVKVNGRKYELIEPNCRQKDAQGHHIRCLGLQCPVRYNGCPFDTKFKNLQAQREINI